MPCFWHDQCPVISSHRRYVDVILTLIERAGDFVGDDIWHRVVHFVTNHEELQPYAAAKVMAYLKQPAVHETMVKVWRLPYHG